MRISLETRQGDTCNMSLCIRNGPFSELQTSIGRFSKAQDHGPWNLFAAITRGQGETGSIIGDPGDNDTLVEANLPLQKQGEGGFLQGVLIEAVKPWIPHIDIVPVGHDQKR